MDTTNPFDQDSARAWDESQQLAHLDWQDGLNPAIASRGPYVSRALEGAIMRELRFTPGMELALYAAPDTSVATMKGTLTYDTLFALPEGAWLIGISATSPDVAGFLIQITLPDGTDIGSVPWQANDIEGALPYFFAEPAGLHSAGEVRVRMINQAAGDNTGQTVLWVIQPEGTRL